MSDNQDEDKDREDRDRGNEQEMDDLSRAIVEALVKSGRVREAMARAAEKEGVCDGSFLVLMLKVKNLAQSMGVDVMRPCDMACDEDLEIDSDEADCGERKINIPAYSEDGEKLTQGEIAFRDYMASRFDENEWLKKHGLIF